MRLALMLGEADVDAMLETMSAPQLSEWIEFHELEPFGPLADDVRGAMLAMLAYDQIRVHARAPARTLDRFRLGKVSVTGREDALRLSMRALGGRKP